MVAPEVALATNREGWNHVAPRFHGGTALPEYGPLAPTESTLHLLDDISGIRALELGCGSGHSSAMHAIQATHLNHHRHCLDGLQ